MNERIRELAEQAQAQPINLPQYVTLDWQKFAELIVRECVTICEEQKEMYAMLNETAGEDATWAAMTTAATSCGTGIKKHFGVER